jgi:hypothetical protein
MSKLLSKSKLPNSYSYQYDYNNALYQFQSAFHVITLMPLCLDFYVLDLHVYLTHERHQIPSDRPHKLDDVGAQSLFSDPMIKDGSNRIKILFSRNNKIENI